MEYPIQYWVVRDENGSMVEAFDIGKKWQAENLVCEYEDWFKGKVFSISLEYIQGWTE